MNTAYDEVVTAIAKYGFHNHRKQEHSDVLADAVLRDLQQRCPSLDSDLVNGIVVSSINIGAPGGRSRKLDLAVHQAGERGNLRALRIGMENKSVITAHRNTSSRFDDLSETLEAIYQVQPNAVLVATILVGTATRVLNVPDRILPYHEDTFSERILPRLSTGDEALWTEFPKAVSRNRTTDALKTVNQFRALPTRRPAETHRQAYDYVAIVPVFVDNVNPPRVDRKNDLGIDVDADYERMLDIMCKAYHARWHLL